jgi:hypothetical protein
VDPREPCQGGPRAKEGSEKTSNVLERGETGLGNLCPTVHLGHGLLHDLEQHLYASVSSFVNPYLSHSGVLSEFPAGVLRDLLGLECGREDIFNGFLTPSYGR